MGQPGCLSRKLSLRDYLGLEINPPIMLPCFVPSHLLFAQLNCNSSVTIAEQEFLPWMPFEAPQGRCFLALSAEGLGHHFAQWLAP